MHRPAIEKISLGNLLVCAAFVPFLICFSLPLEIYQSNLEEMAFHYNSFFGYSFLIFLGFSLIIFLILVLTARAGFSAEKLFLVFSVGAWISSSFFPVDYGVFNGSDLAIDIFAWPSFAELAIWFALGLIAVFVASSLRYLQGLIKIIFVLSLVVAVIRGYKIHDAERTFAQNLLTPFSMEDTSNSYLKELPIFSSSKNILHIILDELQGSVLRETLKEYPEAKKGLRGFYLFEDTTAPFPYTHISLPAIFSGEVYDNQIGWQAYVQQALGKNRFFEYLARNDYQKNLHVYPTFCSPKYLDSCSGMPGVSADSALLVLLDFALLRATPAMTSKLFYAQSEGVFTSMLGRNGYLKSTTGIAWIVFNNFIENITVEDAPPTYKFFQSLITHAPLVLDGNCKLLPTAAANELKHMTAQTRCALLLVSELVSRLEEQGTLDNTLIVISSDHGGNFVPGSLLPDLLQRDIPANDFSRADASLLIKPYNARKALESLREPAQLHLIGAMIEMLDAEGASIAQVAQWSGEQSLVRRYNSMDYGLGDVKIDRLRNFRSFCIDGPVAQVSSWKRLDTKDRTDCLTADDKPLSASSPSTSR